MQFGGTARDPEETPPAHCRTPVAHPQPFPHHQERLVRRSPIPAEALPRRQQRIHHQTVRLQGPAQAQGALHPADPAGDGGAVRVRWPAEHHLNIPQPQQDQEGGGVRLRGHVEPQVVGLDQQPHTQDREPRFQRVDERGEAELSIGYVRFDLI